ncbi:Uncharacterized protein GBIM_05717 [Gryllus bimaculatus]|nr:Uncharacterized protein GBIM_05717 [Gryllus bimaculatus]
MCVNYGKHKEDLPDRQVWQEKRRPARQPTTTASPYGAVLQVCAQITLRKAVTSPRPVALTSTPARRPSFAMRWSAAHAGPVSLLALFAIVQQVACSGVFELRLKSFVNNLGKDNVGQCCSGERPASAGGACAVPCRTRFRVCLKHYQAKIDTKSPCTFGDVITPVLGGNNISLEDTAPVAEDGFTNPMRFHFEFTWPWGPSERRLHWRRFKGRVSRAAPETRDAGENRSPPGGESERPVARGGGGSASRSHRRPASAFRARLTSDIPSRRYARRAAPALPNCPRSAPAFWARVGPGR